MHLGVHAYKAHGIDAATYRKMHGLSRRGLVAGATRATIALNAREQFPEKVLFAAKRDPSRAAMARTGKISPAGIESLRSAAEARRGASRLGIVVKCEWCGVEFCPLVAASKRRFCSRSCASKHTRRAVR